MQKTQKLLNMPLSKEALDCLYPKDDADEPIFTLPAGASNIERNLSKWMENTKITKHITYHCSRHTFAVLALAAGGDIYTVGKLLGHTSINSTQVYADVVMETKVEAISRISSYFSK